jgi:hypothetical protein
MNPTSHALSADRWVSNKRLHHFLRGHVHDHRRVSSAVFRMKRCCRESFPRANLIDASNSAFTIVLIEPSPVPLSIFSPNWPTFQDPHPGRSNLGHTRDRAKLLFSGALRTILRVPCTNSSKVSMQLSSSHEKLSAIIQAHPHCSPAN